MKQLLSSMEALLSGLILFFVLFCCWAAYKIYHRCAALSFLPLPTTLVSLEFKGEMEAMDTWRTVIYLFNYPQAYSLFIKLADLYL